MAWSTVGQHAVNFQQAQTAKSTAVRGLSWFMFFYFVYFIDTYAVLDASKTPRGLRFTRKHLVRNWSGGSELLINMNSTRYCCVVCCVLVVCVLLDIKPFFLPDDIQHNQCPCRFFIPTRDTSYAYAGHKTTRQRRYYCLLCIGYAESRVDDAAVPCGLGRQTTDTFYEREKN